LQDAVAFRASMLGIVGNPEVVEEGRERLWWVKFILESLPAYSTLQSRAGVDALPQYRWVYFDMEG
jgi:hypothetical protein